jgi:hypothetical protein
MTLLTSIVGRKSFLFYDSFKINVNFEHNLLSDGHPSQVFGLVKNNKKNNIHIGEKRFPTSGYTILRLTC